MSGVPRRREASDLVCAICMSDGKKGDGWSSKKYQRKKIVRRDGQQSEGMRERMRDEIKREEGSWTENVMHLLFPNPSSSSSLLSLLLSFVVLFIVIPYFSSLLDNLHPPLYIRAFPSFPYFVTLSRLLTIKNTRHPSLHLSSSG